MKIAVFSYSDMFARGLINALKPFAEAAQYKKADVLIDIAAKERQDCVILDMDNPTDWKMSHDVFTNIMMLEPQTAFVMYTVDKKNEPALVLEKKGALLLNKPVQILKLKEMLKI